MSWPKKLATQMPVSQQSEQHTILPQEQTASRNLLKKIREPGVTPNTVVGQAGLTASEFAWRHIHLTQIHRATKKRTRK